MRNINQKSKGQKYIPLISGVVFLFILIFYITFDTVYAGQVVPRVKFGATKIGGIEISLAKEEVKDLLTEASKENLIFIYNDLSFSYSLKDLGINFDHIANQQSIANFARSFNPFANLIFRAKALFGSTQIKAVYNLSDNFDKVIYELEKDINIDPLPAQVVIDNKQTKVKPMIVGHKLNKDLLIYQVKSQLEKLDFSPIQLFTISYPPFLSTKAAQIVASRINKYISSDYNFNFRDKTFNLDSDDVWEWIYVENANNNFLISLNEEKLIKYVHNLEKLVNQPMQNARFKIKTGKVIDFQPHQFGALLRIKETIKLIQSTLLTDQRNLELPVNYLEPKIKLAELNNLDINELVARGISNFSGSPSNRRHNISVGANQFDLVLIEPSKTFSFNQALGEVNARTGYLPELVIRGDETIPEYGGGLCQVSTTAFRAILNGGYPVIERKNHSYRVVYYEPAGSDATIYPPYPDLKFTNDSLGYILIDTYVDGNNLYFDFYGTSLPYRVEIKGPRIYNVTDRPDPVYIETSTIPEGEIKQIDIAHRGADAILYRYIFNEQGQQIRKDVFFSQYIPWPAKYLIGVPEGPQLDANLDNVLPESSASEEAIVDVDIELNKEE